MHSATSGVVYGGRLVAIAHPTRCHVICTDLTEHELEVVLLMAWFIGHALRVGWNPPDLNRRAEAWAAEQAQRLPPVSTPRRG
jgi:hypothetical protein